MPKRLPQVELRDVARSMGGVAASAGRRLLKDPLNTLLLFASLGLTILFFVLLGQIQPSSAGERVPLSEITKLSDEKDVAAATLLDFDSRVVVDTKGGQLLYAAYPKSDVQTSELVKDLTKGGAAVVVDQLREIGRASCRERVCNDV